MTDNEIIAELKQNAELLRKSDTASVEIVIRQSRLLVHLHKQARAKTWYKTCEKDLEISTRYALRFLNIGEKWATDDTSPAKELYDKLPYDVQKLEFLCELSLDQLKKLCLKYNLRKLDRSEVMIKVNQAKGTVVPEKPKVTASKLLDRWDRLVEQFGKEVGNLDEAGRSAVASQLEDLLTELRSSLQRVTSPKTDVQDAAGDETEQEQDDGEQDDGEDADDDDLPQDEEDTQDEKEVPAPTMAQQPEIPEELQPKSVVAGKQKEVPASKPASKGAQAAGRR